MNLKSLQILVSIAF